MGKEQKQAIATDEKRKGGLKGWQILLINIGAMALVAVALTFLSLGYLKSYTRHNEAFRIPDVAGLNQSEAREQLKEVGLFMEVVDSTYREDLPPNVVIDITPKAGSSIKRGRTIYATVNHTMVKRIPLPNIKDISKRQAEALLTAQGFTNVTIRYIAGNFHDLAVQIRDSHNRILSPGERIPYNSPLFLEISSVEIESDSLRVAPEIDFVPEDNINEGEEWF